MNFQPRLIRLRDAPAYMGVNKNFFDSEIRPYLTEMRLGPQMVAFDRLDLDAWVEDYKKLHGRPAKRKEENKPWRDKSAVWEGSNSGATLGSSTSESEDAEFARAVAQAIGKKLKKSSPIVSMRSDKQRFSE